ncbi:MAG: hypothetical protein ABR537_09390, partial [Gemmatimonadales bacterium]
RMIMSILFPDSGELSVLGRPSALDAKDRIGYLPEERGVYRKMRVGAFLSYIAPAGTTRSRLSTARVAPNDFVSARRRRAGSMRILSGGGEAIAYQRTIAALSRVGGGTFGGRQGGPAAAEGRAARRPAPRAVIGEMFCLRSDGPPSRLAAAAEGAAARRPGSPQKSRTESL